MENDMNIFFVDCDPKVAARSLNDTHVRQMIFESCQLLNTAHACLDGTPLVTKPAPTHRNHPMAKWVRSGFFHYMWLAQHLKELSLEHYYRFNKDHWCADIGAVQPLTSLYPNNLSRKISFDQPPLCMPDEYKCASTVESYRKYYKYGKKKLNYNYTKTKRPTWLREDQPHA